ncbi:MAG TPA: SDR family NAD(P)-dependent oxidoreductase [Isosphaeraceae bacterium]|jgi:short-subunit dehydrogenase|nr:SDR family NAD(P)-dependent oxidoreductase [Isosphaeraceae bacterium]
MTLTGRVAVITGASSGIGAELARQVAAQGLSVGLTARRVDRLEALAEEIRSKGGTAAVAAADAGDIDATRGAIRSLAEALGPVDLLIANAGWGRSLTAHEFSAATIENMMRVNLVGAAAAIEAALPAMLERRSGQIVGISSLAAFRGLPGGVGYCSSKAGLSALLESLRHDLRGSGVAVTIVHPGYVRTPMTEGAGRPLPFLMEVGPAARRILGGIAARRRYVDFPWPLATLAGLARILPAALVERALGGRSL